MSFELMTAQEIYCTNKHVKMLWIKTRTKNFKHVLYSSALFTEDRAN